MNVDIQTAMIAAGAGFITAALTSLISWIGIKQERNKWLFELKTNYEIELYKARMIEYAKVIQILKGLSRNAVEPVSAKTAQNVAHHINDWAYSSGGLIASSKTRKAVWVLRGICTDWKEGPLSQEVLDAREVLIWSLRKDLGISSSKHLDSKANENLLAQLKAEMDELEKI